MRPEINGPNSSESWPSIKLSPSLSILSILISDEVPYIPEALIVFLNRISSFDKNLAYKLNRNGPYLLLFIILVSTIFNYPILSIIMNPIISFITSILIFIISWII